MGFTLNEKGLVLTQTIEGVTMPVDYSFSNINDFVHNVETHYEDLVSLSLGMANHIEELNIKIINANNRISKALSALDCENLEDIPHNVACALGAEHG